MIYNCTDLNRNIVTIGKFLTDGNYQIKGQYLGLIPDEYKLLIFSSIAFDNFDHVKKVDIIKNENGLYLIVFIVDDEFLSMNIEKSKNNKIIEANYWNYSDFDFQLATGSNKTTELNSMEQLLLIQSIIAYIITSRNSNIKDLVVDYLKDGYKNNYQENPFGLSLVRNTFTNGKIVVQLNNLVDQQQEFLEGFKKKVFENDRDSTINNLIEISSDEAMQFLYTIALTQMILNSSKYYSRSVLI